MQSHIRRLVHGQLSKNWVESFTKLLCGRIGPRVAVEILAGLVNGLELPGVAGLGLVVREPGYHGWSRRAAG